MTNIYQFMSDSPILTFLILVWVVLPLLMAPFKFATKAMRHKTIRERGWPPRGRDVDGNWDSDSVEDIEVEAEPVNAAHYTLVGERLAKLEPGCSLNASYQLLDVKYPAIASGTTKTAQALALAHDCTVSFIDSKEIVEFYRNRQP